MRVEGGTGFGIALVMMMLVVVVAVLVLLLLLLLLLFSQRAPKCVHIRPSTSTSAYLSIPPDPTRRTNTGASAED